MPKQVIKKPVSFVNIVFACGQFALAKQSIAKIKYEEAEGIYDANKFELPVSKLNEAVLSVQTIFDNN